MEMRRVVLPGQHNINKFLDQWPGLFSQYKALRRVEAGFLLPPIPLSTTAEIPRNSYFTSIQLRLGIYLYLHVNNEGGYHAVNIVSI